MLLHLQRTSPNQYNAQCQIVDNAFGLQKVVLILSLVIKRISLWLFHEINADYIFFEKTFPSSPARTAEFLSYYTHGDFLRSLLRVSASR